jgi:F-type H+-transporting ATPase subunit O
MLVRQAASTVSSAARPRVVFTRSASSIALKYAQAAYRGSLAQSPQTLTKVAGELNTISTTIKNTPTLAAFVTNPTISAKDRAAGLQTLFAAAEGTGAKKTPLNDITKNLFIVLSENGRLAEINGVIEGFQELVTKYKGELEVVVTSAAPLQKDIMTRLENSLKASQTAQKAKSVKVTNKVRVRTSQNLRCGRMLMCASYLLDQSGGFGRSCGRLWGQNY